VLNEYTGILVVSWHMGMLLLTRYEITNSKESYLINISVQKYAKLLLKLCNILRTLSTSPAPANRFYKTFGENSRVGTNKHKRKIFGERDE